MRVVFDTNIYIASTFKGGLTESIITNLVIKDIITLLCSEEILKEIQEKLIEKFHWQEIDALGFVNNISKISEIVHVQKHLSVITRDPDDNKILECAVSGNADLIVSADQDLIALKEFHGIAIIHPKTLSYTFPKYFKKKKGN